MGALARGRPYGARVNLTAVALLTEMQTRWFDWVV